MGAVAWWTLAGVAVVLAVLTVLSARRPAVVDGDRAAHLRRWAQLHGGYDAASNGFVAGWLSLVRVVALPLARVGLRPDVLSLWGIWFAGGVLAGGLSGGRWALLAAAFVAANGLADGVDGAVAVLSDRVGARGRTIDSAADRLSDGLVLGALIALAHGVGWVTGCALAAAAAIGGLEWTRARTVRRGRLGPITPFERPTRLVVVGLGLAVGGLAPSRADTAAGVAAAVLAVGVAGSWAWLAADLRRRPGR